MTCIGFIVHMYMHWVHRAHVHALGSSCTCACIGFIVHMYLFHTTCKRQMVMHMCVACTCMGWLVFSIWKGMGRGGVGVGTYTKCD